MWTHILYEMHRKITGIEGKMSDVRCACQAKGFATDSFTWVSKEQSKHSIYDRIQNKISLFFLQIVAQWNTNFNGTRDQQKAIYFENYDHILDAFLSY